MRYNAIDGWTTIYNFEAVSKGTTKLPFAFMSVRNLGIIFNSHTILYLILTLVLYLVGLLDLMRRHLRGSLCMSPLSDGNHLEVSGSKLLVLFTGLIVVC